MSYTELEKKQIEKIDAGYEIYNSVEIPTMYKNIEEAIENKELVGRLFRESGLTMTNWINAINYMARQFPSDFSKNERAEAYYRRFLDIHALQAGRVLTTKEDLEEDILVNLTTII